MCSESAITDVQLMKNTTISLLQLKVSICSERQTDRQDELHLIEQNPEGVFHDLLPSRSPATSSSSSAGCTIDFFFFFLNAVGGLEVKSQFIKSTPSKKLSLQVCNDNICMYTSVQELTASFSLQCTPRSFAYNTTYFRNILTQACQCG